MYQDERKLDFHALGREIKRKREAKGWTQEYLAQLVDRTPRSIMYFENRGQHPSLNTFIARKVSCGGKNKKAYSHLYGKTVKKSRVYHSHRSATESLLGFHWSFCSTASIRERSTV
jgi:DNA-binding XRE family transcriptional regulator